MTDERKALWKYIPTRKMTEQEFKTRFPRASASTVALNAPEAHRYPKSPYGALKVILGAGKGSGPLSPREAAEMSLKGLLGPRKANYEDQTDPKTQGSKPKRHKTPALDSTNAGKTESSGRIIVRFIGHRVRPLDPDNFAGGCKDLLDGLRHAGIISGDEPWKIKLETEQVKVSHRSDEKTVIEVTI
jgi:hypothetical protein